ncbi:MAG: RHS repeat-associated core domain-containing protein [Pirellulales bacterium]
MSTIKPRRRVKSSKQSPLARACRIESLEDRRLLTGFTASVTGRHLFYNDSKYDGYTPGIAPPASGANNDDVDAIDTSKSAYLPGAGSTINPVSMSSFNRGINGVFVDITGTHGPFSLADFQFAMSGKQPGINNTPSTWASAPAPSAFTVLTNVPAAGTDRVEFIWDNNAIENRYLEVTVEGNDAGGGLNQNTGLAASSYFYYGNRIGTTFLCEANPTEAFVTDGSDEIEVLNHPGFLQPVTNNYDFDKDSAVMIDWDFETESIVTNLGDLIIARSNSGFQLKINITGPPPPTPDPAPPAIPSLNIILNNEHPPEWIGSPVSIAPAATIIGTATELTSMQVAFASGNPLEHSVLDAEVSGPITKSWFGQTLILSGTASLGSYQAVLRTLTYNNTDQFRDNHAVEGVWVTPYVQQVASCGAGIVIYTPVVSVDDATMTKSILPDDPVDMEFTISLNLPSSHTVSVHYATQDGTAVAGVDYESTSGEVTFEPGDRSQTITVPIIRVPEDNPTVQPDKTFIIELSDPQNALMSEDDAAPWEITGESSATGTIFDSLVTNTLPDPLAEIFTSAFSSPVPLRASAETGDVAMVVPTITGPLADASAIVHATSNLIVAFDAEVPAGPGPLAYDVTVTLEIPDQAGGTGSYHSATGLPPGSPYRLAVSADTSNAETGTYTWEMTASSSFVLPSEPTLVIYHGVRSIVNRDSSPYGAGMWINGLDQIFVQDEPEFSEDEPAVLLKPKGITYVLGDGTAIFFAYNDTASEYVTPRGYFLTLEEEAGGYTIRTPQGVKQHFSENGLLESITEPNGNETVYQYNGDKTLASITDPFQQTVNFGYVGGKLSSMTDAAARTTQVQISGGELTGITSPPPESGRAPLQTSFASTSVTLPSDETVSYSDLPQYLIIQGSAQYFIEPAARQPLAGVGVPFFTEFETTATITANGFWATMTVDSRGWVTEYTDFNGHTTKYERYDNGLIQSITQPGETEPQYEYTYDDQGNMLTRRSKETPGSPGIPPLPEAEEIWTYDSTWNVPDSYTDSHDNVTTYDIDPDTGQLRLIHETVHSVIGQPDVDLFTHFSYTPGGGGIPAGLPDSVTDPNVVETRYDYAIEFGNFIQTVTEAYGTPEAIQRKRIYDLDTMNLVEYVDERQKSTNYEYDDLDRLEKVLEPSPDGVKPRPEWEYRYYPNGLVHEAEDPRDNVTSYDYSFYVSGSLSSYTVTLPEPIPSAGHPRWIYNYDAMGRVYRVVDPRNGQTDYDYDPNGNLFNVTLPVPEPGYARPQWHYEYNSKNLLDFARDPEQNTTNYFYDNRGQLERVLAPPDPTATRPETKYTHDNRGLVMGVADPLGRVTAYGYDSIGRLEKVVGPNPGSGLPQTIANYKYDGNGNLRFETVGATSSLAQTTEHQYDELNRLRTVIQPPPRIGDPSPTTVYTYYPTGELHTLADPNQNLTTWNIDNLGRVTGEIDPLGESKSFEYDAIGNPTQLVDRIGRVTTYAYDALNRMTSERWFVSLAYMETPLRTLSFGYDLAGNLTSASDPSAGYTFLPDNLNRLKSATVTMPGLPPVQLISEYDQNNNRERLTAFIGATIDFANSYGYDNLNRLVDLRQEAGSAGGNEVATKQLGFAYNVAGQVTRLNRFDHVVTDPTVLNPTGALAKSSYIYDGAGRLRTLSHTPSAATIIFQAWAYDVLNRITSYANSREQPLVHAYIYDNNNQVIREFLEPDVTYDYDLGGNRIETDGVTSTPAPGNRLLADGTYGYLYDDEGNLTRRTHLASGKREDFYWDHRNRLVQIQSWTPGLPAQAHFQLDYKYDVFNRRVSRLETTYVDGGGIFPEIDGWVQEKFIYDGDQVVLDFQSVDGAGFQLARRYLSGPAVDQLFAQENIAEDLEDAARVYWLLTDNLGTVRDIVNHAGGLVEHYNYDAFGRLVEGDTSLTRYLYTSREFDATTGLQYNRNRWYDSKTGRWLSEDPSGFAGGDTNLYRYVANSPTNGTDPYGLAEDWAWPWESNATWNPARDALSRWTWGILANQAESNAASAQGLAIGAVPNPAMLADALFERIRPYLPNSPALPEGTQMGMAPPLYGGRPHGNSLSTTGVHDVYVVREIGSRRLLRFGETGRSYLTRFAEHQRAFDKLGIKIEIQPLRSVEGKGAAHELETRYIDTYRRIYGQRPPYNRTNH